MPGTECVKSSRLKQGFYPNGGEKATSDRLFTRTRNVHVDEFRVNKHNILIVTQSERAFRTASEFFLKRKLFSWLFSLIFDGGIVAIGNRSLR